MSGGLRYEWRSRRLPGKTVRREPSTECVSAAPWKLTAHGALSPPRIGRPANPLNHRILVLEFISDTENKCWARSPSNHVDMDGGIGVCVCHWVNGVLSHKVVVSDAGSGHDLLHRLHLREPSWGWLLSYSGMASTISIGSRSGNVKRCGRERRATCTLRDVLVFAAPPQAHDERVIHPVPQPSTLIFTPQSASVLVHSSLLS